jgi:hypothetical protein
MAGVKPLCAKMQHSIYLISVQIIDHSQIKAMGSCLVFNRQHPIANSQQNFASPQLLNFEAKTSGNYSELRQGGALFCASSATPTACRRAPLFRYGCCCCCCFFKAALGGGVAPFLCNPRHHLEIKPGLTDEAMPVQ